MCTKWLLLAILVANGLLLSWMAARHSPTYDELAHVISGISHWRTGDFSLYRVNPPLHRVLAVLPILVLEKTSDLDSLFLNPGQSGRTEFIAASKLFTIDGERAVRFVRIARWSSIPFSTIGGLVCFFWARFLYGARAGLVASGIWAFSPLVLGFGAICTPDVATGVTGGLGFWMFSRWIATQTMRNATIAGMSLGIMLLIKSSWIVAPFAMSLVWLYSLRIGNGALFRNRILLGVLHLTVMFSCGWYLLCAGYIFQGCFRELGDFEFISTPLNGVHTVQNGDHFGNIFRTSWLARIQVLVPDQFLIGIDIQRHDMQSRYRQVYLAGAVKNTGWWYYYLYLMSIKSTVGGLLLFVAGTAYRISWKRRLTSNELCLLFPIVLMLVVLSLHTGLNRHARYLLCIYPMIIVWSSQCFSARINTWTVSFKKVFQKAVSFAIAAMITSSLWIYPHSMSYFNEFVGGPRNGHLHLLGSNVDWGQDLMFLKESMSRRGWENVGLVCEANFDPRILGIEFHVPPFAPSHQAISDEARLQPGKYAVSVTQLHGVGNVTPDGRGGTTNFGAGAFEYFGEFTPVGSVGYSILLYDICETDIQKSRTWGFR